MRPVDDEGCAIFEKFVDAEMASEGANDPAMTKEQIPSGGEGIDETRDTLADYGDVFAVGRDEIVGKRIQGADPVLREAGDGFAVIIAKAELLDGGLDDGRGKPGIAGGILCPL